MKNKKEKSRMINYNRLSPNNIFNKKKYLNVSISLNNCHGRMAEWLTQPVVTRCPSGLAGSIPFSQFALDDNFFNNSKSKLFVPAVTYFKLNIYPGGGFNLE